MRLALRLFAAFFVLGVGLEVVRAAQLSIGGRTADFALPAAETKAFGCSIKRP